MSVDLNTINMKINQHYECIVTTENKNKVKNAAPIGIRINDKNIVSSIINSFTHTLQNIKETNKFVVNLTEDPMVFTESTLAELSEDYYDEYKGLAKLKECDAFFICEVSDLSELNHKNHIGERKVGMLKAEVKEIVINNECVKPLNRSMFALIDALVHSSRLEVVSEDKKKEFIKKINEDQRLIEKIGSEEYKESMRYIKKFIS